MLPGAARTAHLPMAGKRSRSRQHADANLVRDFLVEAGWLRGGVVPTAEDRQFPPGNLSSVVRTFRLETCIVPSSAMREVYQKMTDYDLVLNLHM